MSESSYTAKDMTELVGLTPVRARPGMYIGGTDKRGYHHLLWEVVDNSVDEFMGGYGDSITVTLNEDNSISVEDHGRGIPMDNTADGTPAVQKTATSLHMGGKFGHNAYAVSGGLHGVGLSVVNALSSWMTIKVVRDGQEGTISFRSSATIEEAVLGQGEVGVVSSPLQIKKSKRKGDHGTTVTFLPDPEMFQSYKSCEWDIKLIQKRLRQSAFLNAGLTINLIDNRPAYDNPEVTYCYENGISDFMAEVRRERLDADSVCDDDEDTPNDQENTKSSYPDTPIFLSGDDPDIGGSWEAAFCWFPDSAYRVYSFANSVETSDGGTHVQGYESVLTGLLNRYAAQDHIGLIDADGWRLEASDVRSGLGIVISVKVRDPQFEGQTKGKLNNAETKAMVREGFSRQLWAWMEEHPAEARTFVEKCVLEMQVRRKAHEAAEAARNEKESSATKPQKNGPMPPKLRDSRIHGEKAEMFIVEGDSAMGTAKSASDPLYQALLPIRGKGLNVEKALASRDAERLMANNKELQGIIAAVGAGSMELFDHTQMRYGKIILLTDADDDGRHIELLLMTMFYRVMPGLIENGHLWVARPPLFSVSTRKGRVYLRDEDERDEFLSSPEGRGLEDSIMRFKGLGEMNHDQLSQTAMHPHTRSIVQISVEDESVADETFTRLMGRDTEYKRALVFEHEIGDDED